MARTSCIGLLLLALMAHTVGAAVPLGVHRSNLTWQHGGDLQLQKELVDTIHDAGIRCVRFSFRPPQANSVEHVRYARSLGMHVHLVVPTGFAAFYEPGTDKRPGNDYLWPSYPLSRLDTASFHAGLARLLGMLAQAGTTPHTLELFNEMNWAGFNGDFPIRRGGFVFDETTPQSDPSIGAIVEGTLRYGQVLAIARHVLDSLFGEGSVPLTSAGYMRTEQSFLEKSGGTYMEGGAWVAILKGQSPLTESTVDYTRHLQGVCVHAYPSEVDLSPQSGTATVKAELDALTTGARAVVGNSMPLYITEWGYNAWLFRNMFDPDAARLEQFEIFMEAVNQQVDDGVSWVDTYLFSFDQMAGFAVYDSTGLLEPARIFYMYTFEDPVAARCRASGRAPREGLTHGGFGFLLNGAPVPLVRGMSPRNGCMTATPKPNGAFVLERRRSSPAR